MILDVHGPPENDEPAILIDVRLGIRMPLEIMEPDPVAPGANQRVERAERLDGYVLKNEKARHRPRLALSGAGRSAP
jgi:hypothetical protein